MFVGIVGKEHRMQTFSIMQVRGRGEVGDWRGLGEGGGGGAHLAGISWTNTLLGCAK